MCVVNYFIGFPLFNCRSTFIAYLSAVSRIDSGRLMNDFQLDSKYTLSSFKGVFFKFERQDVSDKYLPVTYLVDHLVKLPDHLTRFN